MVQGGVPWRPRLDRGPLQPWAALQADAQGSAVERGDHARGVRRLGVPAAARVAAAGADAVMVVGGAEML